MTSLFSLMGPHPTGVVRLVLHKMFGASHQITSTPNRSNVYLKRDDKLLRLSICCLCLVFSSPAFAITTGSAFSGPVNDDGVSIYWNPAALGQEQNLAINFELNTIFAEVSYLRAGTNPNTNQAYDEVSFALPAPDFTFSIDGPTPLESLRWVLGGFSPYAIGGLWPEDGAQRFFSKKALIFTYDLSTGVIYRPIKKLSLSLLGGVTYGQLEQNNSIDFGAFANNLLPPGADLFATENPLLEGVMHLEAQGWSPSASVGVWWEPMKWLRMGLGFLWIRDLHMHGLMNVETSEDLEDNLPGLNLRPEGTLDLTYPMPYHAHGEIELELGPWSLAPFYQFLNRHIQRLVVGYVSEVEPDFIEGQQLSVRGTQDDWMAGLRLGYKHNSIWRFAWRGVYDPSYIPDESVHPGNLDFNMLENVFSAQWQSLSATWIVSYAHLHFQALNVTNSLFNLRAGLESGLSYPSANGNYNASGHRFTIGFRWLFR
jgi:hypothetical protein